MPSRLAFKGRFSRESRDRLSQLARPQRIIPQQSDWGGYVPDIDSYLLTAAEALDSVGLLDRGGVLGPDDGWGRIDPGRLPLAVINLATPGVTDDGAAGARVTFLVKHGWVVGQAFVVSGNSVAGYNTTHTIQVVVSATVVDTDIAWTVDGDAGRANLAEPITGFSSFRDAATQAAMQFCFTGRAAVGANGHLAQLDNGTAQWINRDSVLAGARITGAAGNLTDNTFYPAQNLMLFCNEVDVVMRFPDAGATARYEEAFVGFGGITPISCRSLTHFDERALFFNTTEAGAERPTRVRWTNKGAMSLTATGAGFLDLSELGGEGVRIMPLGDVVACYGVGGVAFLRRNLLPTDPFQREYLSVPRGLLSTFAVDNLGSGVHFGLFTDGWFYLDSTGRWTEAGLFRTGTRVLRKWTDTFYSRLNWNLRSRVVVKYDRTRRLVRIAAPMGADSTAPNEVWLYDIDGDRVWKDDYTPVNTPNIWGELLSLGAPALSWDAAGGTWDGFGGTWGDLEQSVGRPEMVHGNRTGVPFRFRYTTDISRDGVLPTYTYISHSTDLGAPAAWKVGDKLRIEHMRVQQASGANPSPISLDWRSEQPTTTPITTGGTITQLKGMVGSMQTDYVAGRVPGQRLSYGLSGTHPALIMRVQMHIDVEGVEEIRET
jgi:hypothetical protein